jgi:hypothetical protein
MASCDRANSELIMLRWMMPFLVAMFALAPAAEAAGPAGKAAARRAAKQLPPGLPRANYKFRTTIAPPALPPYARAVDVADAPDLLFTPSDEYLPYALPVVGVDWLPEYPAGSGNWGLPWYAGPDIGDGNRQPYGYACGVYGYGYGYC